MKTISRSPLSALAIPCTILAALLGMGTAEAQTKTWTGATNGSWGTSGNWDPSGTPVSANPVVFDGTGTNLNTTTNGARTVQSLTYTSNQTSTVTINATTTQSLSLSGAGAVITVDAGNHVITGNGTSGSGTTYDFLLTNANDNRTITIADGASLDIQGRFDTPNASLAKNGNGTLILSGQNGSSGAFQIDGADAFSVNAGVLRFANSNAAGNSRNNYSVASGAAIEIFGGVSQTSSNGTITLNGTGIGSTGALRSISGNNTITAGAASPGTIVLSAASSIGVDADTFTIGKGISGSNSLTKVGAGTLVLGRAAAINNNTYSGATLVDGGTLRFAITGALYGGNSTNWTAANLNAKNGTTLAFNVGGPDEFSTGNVTTLLTNLAASSSTTNGMNAGSSLGFDTTNAGGSFTIADVIADTTGAEGGARGLTKLGTGSLVLSNTNTYTGPTLVSAGTLQVNGTHTPGGGAGDYTVANAATLMGSGATNGDLLVLAGGTVAPGSSIESLGVGSVSIDGGTYSYELDSTAVNADLLYGGAGSTLTLTGSPTLSLIELGAGTVPLNTKFTLISYNGTWNSGTFAGFADDSTFSFSGTDWLINYNDTSSGSNFSSDANANGTAFVTITAVPEPGVLALAGIGIAGIGFLASRWRQR